LVKITKKIKRAFEVAFFFNYLAMLALTKDYILDSLYVIYCPILLDLTLNLKAFNPV